MPTCFLSYARNDDERFVKRLYEDLTSRGHQVWWDKEAMESRGRTFLQEIRDAIEECDRLVAVVGPRAVQSDYVRWEWEHALLFSKGVVPVLRGGDYNLVPPDLSKLHAVDFRENRLHDEALNELLRVLTQPVPPLGPFRTPVPSLPPHFLPRREHMTRLSETVLADVSRPTVITLAKQTTALQGMGGVGKSVLAAAFARAADSRRALDDGIVWLTVGQHSDLLRNLSRVGAAFEDEPDHYVDLDRARDRLPRLLAEKVCLVVLDDVWDVADTEPFRDALGPRCRLLITTREGSLVTTLGAHEHRLDVLEDATALRLLAHWCEQSPETLPREAREVARECGNLPLALSVCGAMARDGVPWDDLRDALREADFSFLRDRLPANYLYDLPRSLKLSVELLARSHADAAKRYLELAVFPFPTDEAVPEAAVVTLWSHGTGLKDRDARKLLSTLERKALLRLEGTSPNRFISLHDLQYDYVRAVHVDLAGLHRQLVETYRERCSSGWPSGPNDGYFFEHVAHHLKEAGRTEELRGLLFDHEWLQAKLEATDPNALVGDFALLGDDEELKLVSRAVQLSAHYLTSDKRHLPSQLCGRLLAFEHPHIQAAVQHARQNKDSPWLCPSAPSLTPPGGPLLRTLQGHSNEVTAVAITPDGRHAVSGSWDNTLMVWDLQTGQDRLTLQGHSDSVTAVAITSDGCHAVSASWDNTLKVWDLQTGQDRLTLQGHSDSVHAVAITPDGCQAVSASGDHTLKVWDLETGQDRLTLQGHSDSVHAVAITLDGCHAVSASGDHTLKVWDLQTGQDRLTLQGHSDSVTAVAMTADGRHVVSGSGDRTLKVWDLETGQDRLTLKGHSRSVEAMAITLDGRHAVSGSRDHTLKVWDLQTGQDRLTLKAHSNEVTAVAITSDGRHAVSGSWDNTLMVWDLQTGQDRLTLQGHSDSVHAVAITPDGCHAVSASWDNTLMVWDLQTGQDRLNLQGHSHEVTAVAITPDSGHAVSASRDWTLKVWDLQTGQDRLNLQGHYDEVTAVAITPDGRYAVSGSWDYTLKVWDLQTGQDRLTLQGHSEEVTAVAITSDGRHAVSGSGDHTLKVWDLQTGQDRLTLQGHSEEVTAVAITPDGRHAVSGSWDHTLKVWDLQTGQDRLTLQGHSEEVTAVAITRDGRHAVSGSRDHTLKVWDLQTGEMIAAFGGDGAIRCVVAPEGGTIIAGDSLGRVHILRVVGF